MTYQANRLTIGYERAQVLNPWVFADLRQPQRQRGFVSPLVYQTSSPTVYHPNLSGLGTEASPLAVVAMSPDAERLALQRSAVSLQSRSVRVAERMALISTITAAVAVAGLLFTVHLNNSKKR